MIEIQPQKLKGNINIQPSKSYLHRVIICSALSKKQVRILHVNKSEDIKATLSGMKSLGLCDYELTDGYIDIIPNSGISKNLIDCCESGSTLRFLLPIGLTLNEKISFTGKGKLMERPMEIYEKLANDQNFLYEKNKDVITIKGNLKSGKYSFPGNISSQFITGMLLALSQEGCSEIEITGKIESLPYIKITLDVFSWFGVDCVMQDNIIKINGGYKNTPKEIIVPGDWSHAANYAVYSALSGGVVMSGLSMEDKQGDRVILELLKKMGADYIMENNDIVIKEANLTAITFDAGQSPDIVPALAVAMALAQGTSRIINAGRLRIKECDRLSAVKKELNALGAKISEVGDELIIEGKSSLLGGNVHAHNDHRIAMAAAIASCFCEKPVIIDNETCVNKSAPDFWQEFKNLGGKYVCRK